MKIALMFAISNLIGGAERRLSRIMDEISYSGIEVNVIIFGKEETVSTLFDNILKRKSVNFLFFEYTAHVIKHFCIKRYDWLMFFDCNYRALPLSAFSALIGTKRLMVLADGYMANLIFVPKLKKILFYVVAKMATKIDVLYPRGFQKIKKLFPRKEVSLTPGSFTDLSTFQPVPKKNVILFLGRLTQQKNPSLLIDSIALVKDQLRQKHYKCVICGDGPEMKTCLDLVSKYKCEDIIKMTGYTQSENFARSAKIFVSIQQFENYPSQALLEAIACGCYVIAGNVGDTELIVKKEFGTITNLDQNEISNKIAYALDFDDKKYIEIMRSAREFAEKFFVVDVSVNHYKKLFGIK